VLFPKNAIQYAGVNTNKAIEGRLRFYRMGGTLVSPMFEWFPEIEYANHHLHLSESQQLGTGLCDDTRP
jgi:hypothetical protein